MNRIYCLFISVFVFLFIFSGTSNAKTDAQDDTVKAVHVTTVPTIDGLDTDDCWTGIKWQNIDENWLPYGQAMTGDDFTGRYKVVWSETTDRIYFLVEVVDDYFRSGYPNGVGGYPSYDVVEIFIDEDKSGGDHTFDNQAFAYHILWEDEFTTFHVMDLETNGEWDGVDHASVFDVATINFSGTYTWEISMPVYDNGFTHAQIGSYQPEELVAGKVMGFSMAYCDNDADDNSRDNFIGSVYVTSADQNEHWVDASIFGTMQLVASQDPNAAPTVINPVKDTTIYNFDSFIMVQDVNTIFDDADEDNLTISVSDDNTELTTHISTNMLMVDPENTFTGTATVVLSADDGLETISDTFTITYEDTSSVNMHRYLSDNSFKMYPNPAVELIQISFESEQTGMVIVSVMDMCGKQEIYANFEKNSAIFSDEINISGLKAGMYLLQVETGRDQYIRKLLVE